MADRTSSKDPGPKDPTVVSTASGPEYPEGTHPVRPASETTYSADNIKYRDNPDKADPTAVAQIADIPDGWPGGQ
jgi:hypothetical protein